MPESAPESPGTSVAAADQPRTRTKNSRVSHRKSRTGCQRCKNRRVKCNEKKPICSNCQRHGMPCVYLGASTSRNRNGGSPSDVGTPAYNPYSPGNVFGMKDMALLHHWSVSCAVTLSTLDWVNQIWQTAVPEIAFQHPCLMHAILAFSALHVAYLTPKSRRDLIIDAATHYNEALRGFREAMVEINEENCDAMFATAIINMFYIFAAAGQRNSVLEPRLAEHLEVLDTEWITMVRGCGAVLAPAFKSVSRGILSDLVEIGDWEVLDPDQDPGEHDGRLLALKEIWYTEGTGPGLTAAYDQTLHRLRQTLSWMDSHAMSGQRISWAGPFIWLCLVPDTYLELLWQRQPPALILFAHFGVLAQRLDIFWWAEGWGRNIVGAVDTVLGAYWRPRIEWPLRIVELSQQAT
ncbi:hypothetical protein GQ53DRAFT_797810 [Thozetella sp. PMI_491]|nr:hypothetical protein GQ53DRAFT_797810 [Thozetella sp. PMI_491]